MSSSTRGEVVCKYCLLLSLNNDESGEESRGKTAGNIAKCAALFALNYFFFFFFS